MGGNFDDGNWAYKRAVLMQIGQEKMIVESPSEILVLINGE